MKTLPILALALAGCVSSPGPQPLATSHPAHPDAAQVPYARGRNELLSITNLVTTAPPAGQSEQHEHEHHK
jgi:hypothetical protein